MRRGRAWLLRLLGTFRKNERERELLAELESHLEMHVEDCMRRGMSEEDARREARLATGGVEVAKESYRDRSRLPALESLWQDLRFGARMLRKHPTFTAVAVATFALGIGANTAIFSAVNSVLLRPLPYPDGDRLVMLWSTDRRSNDGIMPVSPADFSEWEQRARSYSALASSADGIFTLTGEGEPETLIGYYFAPQMFPLLGLRPALGRTFDRSDGDNVVVLSDKLWRRRFHGDARVIGRSIALDQERYRVIGVMPPEFQHPKLVELWVPLSLRPETAVSRTKTFLRLVGRLRPGVGVEQAQAELRAIADGQARDYPKTNQARGANVITMRAMLTGDVRPALLVLLGAVGFVLLLACSNIAGLTLARVTARQRELALRAALGARRSRIARQLLTESLLLALLGGAAGLFLALWGSHLLVQFFPKQAPNLSIPLVEDIPIDGAALLFTFAIALVAGVASGLLPAVRASRSDLNAVLKEGHRSTRWGSRLRPVLVVGQIGLALVLTTSAGALIRSVARQSRSLGFDPSHVLTARVLLDRSRHPDDGERLQMLGDLLARVRAAPGVTSAGVVVFLPLCGWSTNVSFRAEGHPDQEREAGFLVVDPGYFDALHIPLRRGRGFAPSDHARARKVIVIDESLARQQFGAADPVGRRWNFGSAAEPDWREIIGVAGDVQNDPPPNKQRPIVYMSFSQVPWGMWGLVARSNGDPLALAAPIRDAVWSLDANQAVSYVMTMDALVGDAMAPHRITMWLLSFFALLALALAAMGIYAVVAYSVLERTHEIGIRVALGAPRPHVLRLLLSRVATMAGAGIAIGIAGALAAGRIMAATLQGVSARDPELLAAAVALFAAIIALAAYVPLRRALRVDPMVALRSG